VGLYLFFFLLRVFFSLGGVLIYFLHLT